MKLRLYKKPHSEPDGSNRVRLLFEGQDVAQEDLNDFYIYLWIDKTGLLTGFQAIMNDSVTMTSINGSEPVFTCLSDEVIERSTTGIASDADIEKMKIAVGSMVNDDFPMILDRIKMSLFGENLRHIRLTENEFKKFTELCKMM